MKTTMRLARKDDDCEIRKCYREVEMEGAISLSFETEPSYFDASKLLGRDVRSMLSIGPQGELAGIGVRSLKDVFIQGESESIGYLGGLRGKKEFRGRNYLSAGPGQARGTDLFNMPDDC